MQSMATSSRILYDVPCAVCRDHSSGKHYGVFACDGCAGFFKRSVRRDRRYTCKARSPGLCLIDKAHRNQCRACRLAKCLGSGMNKDAVQHERGPRNSTIRRQMAHFLKDSLPPSNISLPVPPALDLAMPKHNLLPPVPVALFHNPYTYNRLDLINHPVVPCLPKAPSPSVFVSSLLNTTEPVMCEAAARLLFMNVKWAKDIPAFASLSLPDRLLLLEESWKDLFIIGYAQLLYPINLKRLFNGNDSRINDRDVETFETVLAEIVKLHPDNNEYACLRAIILFRTSFNESIGGGSLTQGGSDFKRLQDLPAVAALQDRSQVVLNEHTTRNYTLDVSRTSQLLQLLPIIRGVSGVTIVELFFRSTIGDIAIERIISDMYRTGRETV